MKIALMAVPLLGILLVWSVTGQAGVNIDRTRVIMSADQKSVSIMLTNESRDTPYLAQSWIEDREGNVTNDLLALPPLQRIDAGKKAQVRLMPVNRTAVEQLPQDRESLFYFNVREIPPAPADKNANLLQLSTQSRVKLFLRPSTLAAQGEATPERTLQAWFSGPTLTLKNPSPYHITVAWLGQNGERRLPGFNEPIMLAPFSEQALKAELSANVGQLLLGNVDDYGGLRMSRYRCETGRCVFLEQVK